jgi:voltage-gated potassium channel
VSGWKDAGMTDTAVMAAAPVDRRATRLAEWERRASPYIIVAALLPFAGTLAKSSEGPVSTVVGIACWLVFVVDFVVHLRLSEHYVRTRSGKIDLAIVFFTAPWYLLLPGGTASALVTVARLARVIRLFRAGGRNPRLRRLTDQLGQVAIYAGGLLTVCSLIEKWVEPPSSGFTTYGDAFWWGAVTLTTVGYGDIYPATAIGRLTGVVLMLGGVAFLGTLAGTLSAFFGLGGESTSPTASTSYADPPSSGTAQDPAQQPDQTSGISDPVAQELALLRAQVGELLTRLDSPAGLTRT